MNCERFPILLTILDEACSGSPLHLNGPSGMIASSGFPNPASGAECTWIIHTGGEVNKKTKVSNHNFIHTKKCFLWILISV